MINQIKNSWHVILLCLICHYYSKAQTVYSVDQLIDAAKKNSHQLNIKQYQILEKTSKLHEDGIKRYPSVALDGNYQYNFKLPDITIPAGTIGMINTGNGTEQLLPAQDSKFTLGEKGNYNVGVNLYQPITQQAKLATAMAIDQTDIQIGKQESAQTALQLKLQVEQLFYGALILRKTSESGKLRIELAKAKLADGEASRMAGTSTAAGLAGLRADIANEEQALMKIDLQLQDYLSEISSLTAIDLQKLNLQEPVLNEKVTPINDSRSSAMLNPDFEIARLNKEKALLGIKAIKRSNLPDFGIVAGYYRQQGNPILPISSPYVGVSLKWNLQDLFTNREVQNQRQAQLKQAEENMAYTQQQIGLSVNRLSRKVAQCNALITAASKAVAFRKDELMEQQNRLTAGFEIKTVILETKVKLAQAETDLYSAKLQQAIAIAELENIVGKNKLEN
ncbi:outer membrane protein TolC [Pedobacter psychrotolerans]|uniref:Outer membrane protein TolC n=1 Tax=Pedobacter psychrotolerans TaxID=1843235 RepID=A0A4R2HLV0_9SPHI|nr:TolC family protein [Pedobacter psychrotolerans]TCO31177.1 outer membrane protein TolC [Pedobacter psychrotolerans]GGE41691.1 hypothetical protein GCM10011413_04400 [Pedobacter psychrotolerans]